MTIKRIQQQLEDHIDDNKKQFGYMEKGMERLQDDVDKIMDNHLQHLQSDISELKTGQVSNKRDIQWIKKIQWFIVTTLVGTLVTGVVNTYLILKG